MILMKDVYGVPVLLEEEDDEVTMVVMYYGKIHKVKLKKLPEVLSALMEEIKKGKICAEDIVTFFSS